MTETVLIKKWLYSVLAGDVGEGKLYTLVGGRIYSDIAPPEATYPLVIYAYYGGSDVRGVGTVRVLTSARYIVKVIGGGRSVSFAALQTIADRIDELLHGATGSVTGGLVLSCVREQPLDYTETDGTDVYSHLGGIYAIQVQKTS